MALFLAGITIFCLVHLFKAAAPAARDNVVFKLGENPYKGVFSLLILGSLVLIVFGWKATVPTAVYVPPLGPGIVPSVLVLIGLILFFASQAGGYIRRVLRHPQMLGTIAWAIAHLLTNGDSRSVILFGSLGLWALLEILLCNRRDGPREELPAASARADLIAVLVGVVAFGLIGHFHMRLFGVSPLPLPA
ncbi:MAG: NnrU family protein [Gammaproteobacteria bacterium]|nr:NnrU family protein [Gammaproteobacteria bacterium]